MLLVLILAAGSAQAQTSAFMDQMMVSKSVNWGQAAYLVLVASDNLAEDATEQRSLDLLKELKWADAGIDAEKPIALNQFSFLLMKAFGIPGGMLYTFFPGPRYAFKELTFKYILSSDEDPDQTIDGPEGIRILGKVMDSYAGKKGNT